MHSLLIEYGLLVIGYDIPKKWSFHPALSSLWGLDFPVIQIRKMNKPHLDVFRDIRNTNQEERPSHYSDITSAVSQLVKCPSSQGQNKRKCAFSICRSP